MTIALQKSLKSFHPAIVIKSEDHIAWVLLQQLINKGCMGLKFVIAARILGPEKFGLVGVAIAALAIVESLADTGMTQAIIQRSGLLTLMEGGAVWTLQIVRGCLITFILAVLASPIAELFGIPQSSGLIAFAAILPALRNAVNPGYYYLQRSRNFRAFSINEITGAILDFIGSVFLLKIGLGPASVLIGVMFSDMFRLIRSWISFRIAIKPNLEWSKIREMGRYGLWIWASSTLTVILNQFDKIIVARWLGVANFGIYQTSARFAQLGISDIAVAAGQYLFPTMSKIHHTDSSKGKKFFFESLIKMTLVSGGLSAIFVLIAPIFVKVLLGSAWISAIPVLRIQCLSMWIGALIAVCVAYCRASGNPKFVSYAGLIQLVVLVVPSYWVIKFYGVIGMAFLVMIALFVSFIFMIRLITINK